MGAWGPGTFEDDVACDWLEDLGDSDPVAFFRQCLDLSDQDEFIGHVACIGVICTAEMIHALLHGPRGKFPQAALDWLEQHRGLQVGFLLPAATVALDQVLGCDSEIRELWEDDGEQYPVWRAGVVDLVTRLTV